MAKKEQEKPQGSKKLGVTYKGRKTQITIQFPIGVKTLGGVRGTMVLGAGETVELDEDDAHKLAAIDSNFVLPDGVECKYKKGDVIRGYRAPDKDGRMNSKERAPKLDVPDGVEEYEPKKR